LGAGIKCKNVKVWFSSEDGEIVLKQYYRFCEKLDFILHQLIMRTLVCAVTKKLLTKRLVFSHVVCVNWLHYFLLLREWMCEAETF